MGNKKHNQKQHTKRRVLQRFDLTITDADYQEMLKIVQSQNPRKYKHLETQSNRVSFCAIRFRDKWIPIIYDKTRKSIVSVLPDTSLIPYKKLLGEQQWESKNPPLSI